MDTFTSKSDGWNAELYDDKHSFVSTYGKGLIELLAPKQEEKILDLGCGTGDLANALFKIGVDIIGVDKSNNMVEQAITKYPHIEFLVKDATQLGYHSEFDAVFSNATLHWVQPANQALTSIYQCLKKGGRFVAEFGGKGNVQTITDEIIRQIKEAGFHFKKEQFPWFYPSIGEYSTLMEEAGFRVTFAQHFDRPTQLNGDKGLENWINMFGNVLFKGISDSAKSEIIAKVENSLKEVLYENGTWMADYKRIRVIGVKE